MRFASQGLPRRHWWALPLLAATPASAGPVVSLADIDDDFTRMFVCVLPLLLASLSSLVFVFFLRRRLLAKKVGKDIDLPALDYFANQVKTGSVQFLRVEYRYLTIYVLIWCCAAFCVFSIRPIVSGAFTDGGRVAIALAAGALLSGAAGWIGMDVATEGNVRTAVACAARSLSGGLEVAFTAGSAVGFGVVGLASLGVSSLLLVNANDRTPAEAVRYLHAFGFGASSIALFARVCGGIYAKAADVGADLVGKIEVGVDEDDPRNPAVVADSVGDNVGGVAGMGADLFESFCGSLIGACTLAGGEPARVALPLWLAAAGLVSSMASSCFVRAGGADQGLHTNTTALMLALERGVYIANVLFFLLSMAVTVTLFGAGSSEGWQSFVCTWLGMLSGMAIGKSTEFFTSLDFGPTISIKDRARAGPATVVMQGLGVGMASTALPTAVLVMTIVACDALAGKYGVSLASVGMLGTLGISLSTDAFGPVADGAGGLAEMAELGPVVRAKTDALDALGNTTAAIGKGFAVGSAVLTSLSLLAAFEQEVTRRRELRFEITSPVLLAGTLVGAMLPFLFAALALLSVSRAASQMIDEVRRQFCEVKNKKGTTLLQAIRRVSEAGQIAEEDDVEPDTDRCVLIATQSSVREMMAPGAYAVLTPLLVGLLVGPRMLVGLLAGSIASASMLALTMGTAGGAWDSAKKLCERMQIRKSEQGRSCVVGDTVGDPFKDTAAPSLDILLKLTAMLALLIAPLINGNGDWEEWWRGLGVVLLFVMATVGLVWRGILTWADPLDETATAPVAGPARCPSPPSAPFQRPEPAPSEASAGSEVGVRFTKVESFVEEPAELPALRELPELRVNAWSDPEEVAERAIYIS